MRLLHYRPCNGFLGPRDVLGGDALPDADDPGRGSKTQTALAASDVGIAEPA